VPVPVPVRAPGQGPVRAQGWSGLCRCSSGLLLKAMPPDRGGVGGPNNRPFHADFGAAGCVIEPPAGPRARELIVAAAQSITRLWARRHAGAMRFAVTRVR